MKLSLDWLQSYLKKPVSTEALLRQLPMAGLEVEAVEPVAGAFTGVVVAEVQTCEPHPNADRLRLCAVNNGQEVLPIVCGGKNVRQGLKVALAQVGAVLPGNFKIKKSKIRGEQSLGMLCSETELGMADSSEGIMELPDDAPVGEDIRQYLGLDDSMLELDLTPNRGDCLSLEGVAREVSAITDNPLHALTTTPPATAQHSETLPVNVMAAEACPRYLGRVIKGINPQATSPLWLQEKLRRSGLRPISAVVDVTNYVMLELGQPLHAFDLAKLSQHITVRFAHEAETLTLLDGQSITLTPDTLIIADSKGPLAIAGVMGGELSGCSEQTQDVFLESAFFNPLAVAGTARRYGLHTDSAHRFERGVDPNLQQRAIERATELLLEIVGGVTGEVIEVSSESHLPKPVAIPLRLTKLNKLLGMELAEHTVVDYLQKLHMHVTENTQHAGHSVQDRLLQVTAPSYRFDIQREVDLIEEVARMVGYDQIPVSLPHSPLRIAAQRENQYDLHALRHKLADYGYHEAITYSFVDPKLQQQLFPQQPGYALKNPISPELSVMRQSLWPGLLRALLHNQHRQQSRVRLFEIGKCFNGQGTELNQEDRIAGIVMGDRLHPQWNQSKAKTDFFDVKGDLEQLFHLQGEQCWQFKPAQHSALHPGQSSRLIYNGKDAGWLGALHPSLQEQLGCQGEVFLFELALSTVTEANIPKFVPLSKFPHIRRELALVVKNSVSAAAIQQVIATVCESTLKDCSVLDVYAGEGIPEGHKSVAVGMILQHAEKTLEEQDISTLMDKVLSALQQQLQASLRE